MGGKGRLNDMLMKKFQRFYGKAICSNVNDAEAVKRALSWPSSTTHILLMTVLSTSCTLPVTSPGASTSTQ